MNSDQGEYERDMRNFRKQQVADLEKLIRWYFPAQEHARAIWLAWHESGMDPGAWHRTDEYGIGLFNLDPLAVGIALADESRLQIPLVNVAAAFGLWLRQGWRPWGPPAFPKDIAEEFSQEG